MEEKMLNKGKEYILLNFVFFSTNFSVDWLISSIVLKFPLALITEVWIFKIV